MERKKTITEEFGRLKVGQSIEFPAEQSMSARSMASNIGFKLGRTFKTETNREKRVLIVTRTK